MDEVWVAETWGIRGEGFSVLGVYDSQGAVYEAFQGQPNMAVYIDEHGQVRGRPRLDLDSGGGQDLPQKWARGYPVIVQRRKRPPSDAFRLTGLPHLRRQQPPAP